MSIDYDEFDDITIDYYIHHESSCFSKGGAISREDAHGEVNRILEDKYGKKNDNIVSAFNDAHDGTNGGLRAVLDVIADALKAKSVENYVNYVFDRYVTPNSWDEKVDIIRQFISAYRNILPSSIEANKPERYAHNYSALIGSYIDGIKQTSSMFRRL